MIAQMVGAGTLVALLLKGSGISFNMAVTGVGILMVAYVVFGGMLATTWVQIIKAILLIAGTIVKRAGDGAFSFQPRKFLRCHCPREIGGKEVNFLEPGLRYKPP